MTINRCLLLLVGLEMQVLALEKKEEGKSSRRNRKREFWDTDPNNPDPVGMGMGTTVVYDITSL